MISAKQYGPEAENLFQRVRKQADKAGRGSLDVDVSDPDAVIYVDERIHEKRATIGDLVPGVYRVLVVSREDIREYSVEILANHQLSRLTINWDLDSVVVLGNWVGFKFASDQDRAHEGELVAELVGKDSNAMLADVLTVSRTNGHPAVAAATYNAHTGKRVHECKTELRGYDDQPTFEQLTTCLLDAEPAIEKAAEHAPPDVDPGSRTPITSSGGKVTAESNAGGDSVPQPAEPPPHRAQLAEQRGIEAASEPEHRYRLSAVAIGAGLATFGVGAFLDLTVSPPPLDQPQPPYLSSPTGIGLMIGGGVVTAVGDQDMRRTDNRAFRPRRVA